MKPLVSVIVPVYNLQNYLEKCLNSLLEQTYSSIEFILVNDGSKDLSGVVLDEYAKRDSRIRVCHKENGGVTSARLKGIELARGEYIGFVDGDDYVEPTMYEQLMNNALKYSADISHCGYKMVFPNGKIIYYHNTGKMKQCNQLAGVRELLTGEMVEPGLVNKVFKAELFADIANNPLMDLGIKNNEDLLMNYCLFKKAQKSVYEDFCPYHYLLRKGSAATTQINVNKLQDPLKVLSIIKEDLKDINELYSIAMTRWLRQLVYVATYPSDHSKQFIKEAQDRAKRELVKALPETLFQLPIGIKMKLMVIIVAIFPDGYRWIHSTYEKLKGIDKLYEIE